MPGRPGPRNPRAPAVARRAPGWADLGDGAHCEARPREKKTISDHLPSSRRRRHWGSQVGARRQQLPLASRRGDCAQQVRAIPLCNSVCARVGGAQIPLGAPPVAQEVWRRQKKGTSRRGAWRARPRTARASMSRSTRRCGAIFSCAGTAREAAGRVCLRAALRSVSAGARPADYSATCPASWSLDSDGGCFAPADYAGPCVSRKRFVSSPAHAVGAAARPSPLGAGRKRWRSRRGNARARIGA